MQTIYRKELSGFHTEFLLKMKETLMRRIEIEKRITKPQSHMLVDVLSELEERKIEVNENYLKTLS